VEMSQGVVRDKVLAALEHALDRAKRKGQLRMGSVPTLTLDSPKRPEWGDLASTVAMTLAPTEQRPPHEVAEIILRNLEGQEHIFDRIDIVRPGFLNMTVRRDVWLKVLEEIETSGDRYGRSVVPSPQRLLLEYVSANPTGPLHVGHGRGAAVGKAVANLLRAIGHDVVEEYYVNDAGRQMKLLGASVYTRYLNLCGRAAELPEDGYRGAYIEAVAERVRQNLGDAPLALAREMAEARCQELAYRDLLEIIRRDLQSFGIEFDSWFSEASLLASGAVDRVLAELQQKGLVFEQEGAIWFRSSAFGDEKDRVVRKQEGEYTYLASDIAYHRDKLLRGYDQLINVWGADHHGYIPRMQAVIQAYGYPTDRLRVVLVQMVNLLRAGKKIEMSKRAGEFITLREVMEEVGTDAAKFFFLMRRSDTHVDFDLDLAKQQSAENPVYYVQYAHARIASLFRVAHERGIPLPKWSDVDLTVLKEPDEFVLIRKLSAYPSLVQGSAVSLEPHRLTFYLQELAALLHTFYFRHRILPPAVDMDISDARTFVTEEESLRTPRRREPISRDLTAARLILMQEVQTVFRNALAMLGITAPERM
jgi:arginyl-tRNA synthetase